MLSDQILIDRAGNFTASENHRLMAGWDKPKLEKPQLLIDCPELVQLPKKPLVSDMKNMGIKATGAMINEVWAYLQSIKTPQGLITYAKEKALETLFDYDPSLYFETVHTRNGNERELECIKLLSDATGLEFVNIGDEQAHIHTNEVGATPDGIVLDDIDMIVTGAEVKCKSPLHHAELLLIENNEDLKNKAFEHYVQVQTQMLVTGADHWYFACFNPYAKYEWMKFKYIIIGRDDDFTKILKERIEIAKKIKAEFLNEFQEANNEMVA